MNQSLIRLYHCMPPAFRSLAASARGLQLQRLRYGPETNALIEQALEREHWSPAQWRAWREDRLAFLLHRAATRVPYYRDQWAERRRRGDRASAEAPRKLARPHEGRAPSQRPRPRGRRLRHARMSCEHTSGTSGKPLDLWLSRATVRAWYALFEARCRQWYGLSRHDRWAIFGGQLVAPVDQTKPPFWVWNAGLRQLYLSVYHISPALAPSYIDALRSYRVTYIVGYPSALDAIAESILRLGIRDLAIRAVIANAEPLRAAQRRNIEAAFRCPVRETYGHIRDRRRRQRVRAWRDASLARSRSPGNSRRRSTCRRRSGRRPREHRSDEPGHAADPLSHRRPLLARRRAKPTAPVAAPFPCSARSKVASTTSSIPAMAAASAASTPSSRPAFRFRRRRSCRSPSIGFGSFSCPAPRSTPDPAPTSSRLVRERLGDMQVILESVERVPRGANGKFRAVICNLPPDELQRAKSMESQTHATR